VLIRENNNKKGVKIMKEKVKIISLFPLNKKLKKDKHLENQVILSARKLLVSPAPFPS